MTKAQANALLQAVEDSGIKAYSFDIDDGVHFYNGENSIVKLSDELIVNLHSNTTGGSIKTFAEGSTTIMAAWCEDAHRFSTAGTPEQVQKFMDSLSISLTEEEVQKLVAIHGANYDIKPATGNYVDAFHYLSKKQYDALTPAEQQAYDTAKEKYETEKANYLGKNQAAQITAGW